MSPPPTNIDGTDITGATIDGQDVQEITVDGQTVFTSAPQINLPVAYSNLVAWYPFDSATYGGSNADDVTAIIGGSGDDTAYDGTVNGATYQSSGGVTDINAGANSGAFDFDGTNDDIALPGPFNNFSQMTVMGWVNRQGNAILAAYSSAAQNNDAQFVAAGDNVVAFFRGTTGSQGVGGPNFPTNTDVHVAFTYDGTNFVAYEDGVSVGTATNSIGQLDPVEWKIGSDDVTGGEAGRMDGQIDDFRIYDTALTGSQVSDIYDNTEP